MLTLEELEKDWEETGRHGTEAQRLSHAEEWLPYYRYLAGRQDPNGFQLPEERDGFLQTLADRKLLLPGDTVLDIGAGMGSYTFDFAAMGCKVTALDVSPDCVELIRRKAAACGADTVTPVLSPWEKFTPAEKFDVTFSSFCPAICNVAELRRMESMTDRLCCLVAVMKGSYDLHRKRMMGELSIVPHGGMTTEAIYYFNALYLMGRRPNVMTRTIRSEYRIPAETILEQYSVYFEIFGISRGQSLDYLRRYLDRYARDGFLTEKSVHHLAQIFWKPEGEEGGENP